MTIQEPIIPMLVTPSSTAIISHERLLAVTRKIKDESDVYHCSPAAGGFVGMRTKGFAIACNS